MNTVNGGATWSINRGFLTSQSLKCGQAHCHDGRALSFSPKVNIFFVFLYSNIEVKLTLLSDVDQVTIMWVSKHSGI